MKDSKVIDALNVLLADTHILNVKLHNYHWNIVGPRFFSIHEMTEKCDDYFFGIFDDVAERILQLEAKPLATTKAYLEAATLSEETGNAFTPEAVLNSVIADLKNASQKRYENP